ncbi:MAG: hypothetical protein AB1489_29220, partial [Acidobacteriota bacterium]
AGQLNFTFNTETASAETAAGKWNWAATVFGDPLALPARLQIKSPTQLPEDGEASLYGDWQTRDTELGYRLLEPRVPQYKLAIHCFRNGLVKRQRAGSLLRTKLEALEKINEAEPNPALRHPLEMLAAMQREITESVEEYQYLRNYLGRIESLSALVEQLAEATETGRKGISEQLFRLIGLSWKGQMKIQAFRQRFPHLRYHLNQAAHTPLRYQLAGTAQLPGLDIILSEETATYLIHCLETIAALADESRSLFDTTARKQFLNSGWPPALMMLRALVELFYFCNFEIPYAYATVYLDRDDPTRLWIYQEALGQWQSSSDEPIGEKLKRQASDTVSLLIAPPPFLNCIDTEELSRYCRPSITAAEGQATNQHQPYTSIGLARLEVDSRNQLCKFQSGYEFSTQLIEQLVATQPHLMRAFQSGAGGPLETLLALARFEPIAFKVAGENPLPDNERFALLGRCWRLLAKHRPLALLGHDYAKAIYTGMAAVGEPPPDRSSLLSVHLSSVFTKTALGKSGNPLPDPLTALMLADQIRLLELISATWSFMLDAFTRLQQVTSEESLARLLTSSSLSPEHEPGLASRFNSKWINATQSIWSLMRGTAPAAWNFWTRLFNKSSVQTILASYNSEGALNYLFQVSADLVRLMLLLEACSPVIAERMSTDAETAGRQLLAAFTNYLHLASLAASLDYYFDPDTQHDSWIAFVTNLRKHLEHLAAHRQHTEETKSQLEMVQTAITQLEIQYPQSAAMPSTSTQTVISDVTAAPSALVVIDEVTAESIELICQRLLNAQTNTPNRLPELIALARVTGLAEDLRFLAQAIEALAAACQTDLLTLIFTAPSTTRNVTQFLRQAGLARGSASLDEPIRAELIKYLNQVHQLTNYVQPLLGQSALYQTEAQTKLNRLAFTESEQTLAFYLWSLLGRTFCTFAPVHNEVSLLASAQEFVKACVGDKLSGWQPEFLLLGGGMLRGGHGRLTLTGTTYLNPCFTQTEGPVSLRLLWYTLKMRFEYLLQILHSELPNTALALEL